MLKRGRFDIVSVVLVSITFAAVVAMSTARPAYGACSKYCGMCSDTCTQRDDGACTGGDKCLVMSCTSTFVCFDVLLCKLGCQDTPNCCQGLYVDDCGTPGTCPYLDCPCMT